MSNRRPEVDSETLAAAAQQGDQAALAILLERHKQEVYRIALRMSGSPADAEEILQDSFERLLRYLNRYDPTQRFRPWLLRIAVNRARTFLRMRALRQLFSFDEQRDNPPAANPSPASPSPEGSMRRVELRRVLQQALLSLPANQREVFVLKQVEGLSYEEIANITGDSSGALKVRNHRARAALLSWMQKRGVTFDAVDG